MNLPIVPIASIAPIEPPPALQVIVDFYHALTPATLDALGGVYIDDAWFKDPFNEVRGLPAIRKIFHHMFEQVEAPRFVVTSSALNGDQGFLAWTMHYRSRGASVEQQIRGASHLVLAADGRIAEHRDYWDAAEELYEKIPLLGWLMRLLKKRLKA